MGECVSKKEVLEILRERAEEYGRCMAVDKQSAVLGCMDAIRMMKPADVAPVVYGKWVYTEEWGVLVTNRCSRCGQTLTTKQEEKMNYCPNCGAKMYNNTPAYRMGQRLKVRCNHDR